MHFIRSRGLLPLTGAALVSLCATLPACIEDIYVPSPPPGGGPGDGPDDVIVQPPYNPQVVAYDVSTFANQIQPLLDAASCGVAGCHAPDARAGAFALWHQPLPGSIEMWSNLQYVASLVELVHPEFQGEETTFYLRATDRHRGIVIADPGVLEAWLEDASARFQGRPPGGPGDGGPGDGGPGDGDPGTGYPAPFDAEVFKTQIQPILDGGNCSVFGCHARGSNVPFSIHPRPSNSVEIAENMQAVVELIELDVASAQETTFYLRATDSHRAIALPEPFAQALADWIQRGLDAAGAE